MNYNDENAFRNFIAQTRDKAGMQLNSSNVGADFKEVIQELLQIVEGAESLMSNARSGSADSRILKSKMDQLKKEHFELKQKHDRFKKQIFDTFTDDIVAITSEAGGICKRHEKNEPDFISGRMIMASAKKIVNSLAELTKA